MPKCLAPIVLNDVPVGEICHIKARNKNGPRYDPSLSQAEKDAFPNLLLLCRTCHKVVDSKKRTFTAELLTDIKAIHERSGDMEITPEVSREAALVFHAYAGTKRISARTVGKGVSVAVGDNNRGPITITQNERSTRNRYSENSIGADANLCGYVDYLFGLGVEYWKGVEEMTAGRLGKKIKKRFRLKLRTRNHLAAERFQALVDFIIMDILLPSPVGRRHTRNGTKLCSSFEEWRNR